MSDRATDPLDLVEAALKEAVYAMTHYVEGYVGGPAHQRAQEALATLASVRERERLQQAVVEAAKRLFAGPLDDPLNSYAGDPHGLVDEIRALAQTLAALRAHAEKEGQSD